MEGRFGPADERLAADWQRAGVPLEMVRRAILLGSVRKSMSLLDRPGGEPVRSLRYFASLLEEVRTESFPDSYWRHIEFNLRRLRAALGGTGPSNEREVPVQIWHRQTRPPAGVADKEERG